RFPKDLILCQKWLDVCGLNYNDDVSHTYLCSIHFAEADINRYDTVGRHKSVIKPGAVPSLFISNPLIIQDLSSQAWANMNEYNTEIEDKSKSI
ncbi:hypothetical protein X777_14598, partial [Ooceraea biroi]